MSNFQIGIHLFLQLAAIILFCAVTVGIGLVVLAAAALLLEPDLASNDREQRSGTGTGTGTGMRTHPSKFLLVKHPVWLAEC